jgi:hypothetical protein
MIANETTLPPATPPPDDVTVTITLAEVGPLKAAALAVTVVVPAPTAVTRPEAPTVATEGLLELQLTELVMFWVDAWFALP